MTIVPHAWRQTNRGLWASSPREGLTTLGAIVGILSTLVATAISVAGQVSGNA